MRRTLCILLLAAYAQVCLGQELCTIEQLNTSSAPINSHQGVELFSALEPMAEYCQTIPASLLGCKEPNYARIKKLSNGSYLLLYQSGRIASNIFYSLSSDLRVWTPGELVFMPQPIDVDGFEDSRRYSSADATVLANGDIIVYASYRANKQYRYHPEANGIMMRRSSDNGKTWSEESIIYRGTTWEPYILQLPSGELQCYFTDTDPLIGNSGTSMIVSVDNGASWSPNGVGKCYKVIRQYKYSVDGKPIYTDQMPCVRLLNDGRTLLAFVEARLESAKGQPSAFKMSLAYAQDSWKHLQDDEVGPTDRQDNLFDGAGGYISQFPSGETLISCNIQRLFSLKLGTADGRSFRGRSWSEDWIKAFDGEGYWGATEVISAHEALAVMHTTDGIQLARFYLNHQINAPKQSIKVDGNNAEWHKGDALFVGGESGNVQTCVRAAYDNKNLYLIIDHLNNELNPDNSIELHLCSEGDDVQKIVLSPDKLQSKKDGVRTKISTFDNHGYVAELALPLSKFKDKIIKINVVVRNGGIEDSFAYSTLSEPETWQRIILE